MYKKLRQEHKPPPYTNVIPKNKITKELPSIDFHK